jgi:hypothetical protein
LTFAALNLKSAKGELVNVKKLLLGRLRPAAQQQFKLDT